MKKKANRRIVMVKAVAQRFLEGAAKSEYRIKVYHNSEVRNLVGLLRSFRDGKVAMAGVKPLGDLGIKDEYDSVEVWSGNKEALKSLEEWFSKRGYVTTGLW